MNFKDNKIKIIGGAVAIIVILAVIIGIVVSGKGKKKEEILTTKAPDTTVEETTTEEPTTADPNAGKVKSNLTGLYIGQKQAAKRPVAVMINNIYDALPQSGVSDASVIYEAPVEGGITRMMAMFENYDKLEKIGSIRSCRIYYCYFALEWDAIYCHYGQSKYALDFLKSGKIDTISAFNAGNDFYQTTDRFAPHNTYIGADGIDNAIETLGHRRKYEDSYEPHFQFAEEDDQVTNSEGMAAKTVSISYPHNYPYFQYDKQSKTYLRYEFDEKHIDVEKKNKQLECKNIIIQFVDNTMYDDGKSLDIKLTGDGKGYYITNGNAIEINWKKDELLGRTEYTNAETGKEIVLNPGKSWFCIVQNSTNVTIEE